VDRSCGGDAISFAPTGLRWTDFSQTPGWIYGGRERGISGVVNGRKKCGRWEGGNVTGNAGIGKAKDME